MASFCRHLARLIRLTERARCQRKFSTKQSKDSERNFFFIQHESSNNFHAVCMYVCIFIYQAWTYIHKLYNGNENLYLYNTNSVCVCVCVSVKYRRPNGWTDHDQIWHVYADRPGNGSYQKKMVPRMVRKGGLIGTILRSGYLAGGQRAIRAVAASR